MEEATGCTGVGPTCAHHTPHLPTCSRHDCVKCDKAAPLVRKGNSHYTCVHCRRGGIAKPTAHHPAKTQTRLANVEGAMRLSSGAGLHAHTP